MRAVLLRLTEAKLKGLATLLQITMSSAPFCANVDAASHAEEPKSWQIGRSKVFLLLGIGLFRGSDIQRLDLVTSSDCLYLSIIFIHLLRKEEVQAKLEKAIGEAVKARVRDGKSLKP